MVHAGPELDEEALALTGARLNLDGAVNLKKAYAELARITPKVPGRCVVQP